MLDGARNHFRSIHRSNGSGPFLDDRFPITAHDKLIPASRASACASNRSSFLRLSPISRTFRAFATITSCPHLLSKRLIQGECVPVSSVIRLRGIAPKISCNPFEVVRGRSSTWTRPASSNTQYYL